MKTRQLYTKVGGGETVVGGATNDDELNVFQMLRSEVIKLQTPSLGNLRQRKR